MKNLVLVLMVLVSSSTLLIAQTIATDKSVVNFTISNMKVKTVSGTFSGMSGVVVFDPQALEDASFNVCIEAASVNTENEKRDEHLRQPDFFEVATYPTICFESTSVEKTTEGYVSKGTLQMHGVKKEVSIAFVYQDNRLVGNFSVNRFDYGVGESINTMMVGDVVNLEIVCYLN